MAHGIEEIVPVDEDLEQEVIYGRYRSRIEEIVPADDDLEQEVIYERYKSRDERGREKETLHELLGWGRARSEQERAQAPATAGRLPNESKSERVIELGEDFTKFGLLLPEDEDYISSRYCKMNGADNRVGLLEKGQKSFRRACRIPLPLLSTMSKWFKDKTCLAESKHPTALGQCSTKRATRSRSEVEKVDVSCYRYRPGRQEIREIHQRKVVEERERLHHYRTFIKEVGNNLFKGQKPAAAVPVPLSRCTKYEGKVHSPFAPLVLEQQKSACEDSRSQANGVRKEGRAAVESQAKQREVYLGVVFPEIEGESPCGHETCKDLHSYTLAASKMEAIRQNQEEEALDEARQRERDEKTKAADELDPQIHRWSHGKEGNLRGLLSTLQNALWPECKWDIVPTAELVTPSSVKKVYRIAQICLHPDKVQQRRGTFQHTYVANKVFGVLREAWDKFSSEELV